jgi:ferredoxin
MEKENLLSRIRRRPDPDLKEVADGVHCLREPLLCRTLCPKVCPRVAMQEYARGAKEMPCRECEACIEMVPLRSDVLRGTLGAAERRKGSKTDIVVNRAFRVLWASHLPVLVALAKAVLRVHIKTRSSVRAAPLRTRE